MPSDAKDAQDIQPGFGTFVKVTFASQADIPTALTPMWTSDKNMDVDTATSAMCDAKNQQAGKWCVIVGPSITLNKGVTLRAYGTKPLVLLATSTFDLEGTIDVSSKHDGTPTQSGAGALAASACTNTTVATGNSGGFGGSFMGKGGDGSAVDGDKGMASPALAQSPTDLRGGCPGGDGSSTTLGTSPAGGTGGGAVAIIAHDKLVMNGKINASGAGGHGGPAVKSGGAGGGSGGMIVLDVAPSGFMVGAGPDIWLFTNGGGGGQGGTGTGTNIGAGADGQESPDPSTPGAGGSNTARDGGHGGDGSEGKARLDGGQASNANNMGGGGGGGGGAGFIHAPSAPSTIVASPAISP